MEDIFVKGSAFYGLYFIASFPMFLRLDEYVGINGVLPHTMYQTVSEAMGCGMVVLLLLDFCRIYFNIDLHISASQGAVYLFENQCVFG